MTPRQRRITELIQARARIDAQLRPLVRDTPVALPVLTALSRAPVDADWLTQAHRNQVHLAFLGPHIRHADVAHRIAA